jgi:aminoglycoside phosphotransferase family enzyme/predicted kinase
MIGNDFDAQQRLIQALRDPIRYRHAAKAVRVLETHISWVLLAGRHAYKIKKAVDLGFLDFTLLAARRFYCMEEIRINRRLAPSIYLDVVPIGGSPEQPQLGITPAFEYAVRMRRFSTDKMLDRLLARGQVTSVHIDQLAETLARFHAGLPPASADTTFGSREVVQAPTLQNFEQLEPLLNPADHDLLNKLRQASEAEFIDLAPLIDLRRQQGWVRECHGDLHLGNIVLLGDSPTPFDGIEFNAELRWIDVMSEVAFLVMDLLYRNRDDLAWHFLDAYLQLSGDYEGIGLLRYYLAYRAMVRAKIVAIRARQPDTPPAEAEVAITDCHAYLMLAGQCLKRRRPILIITHGLPGSGKTLVAQEALWRLQAIRIRSDVERKRLYGLAPLQSSRSSVGDSMYSAEATQRTYTRLYELAHGLLAAGHNVIVDAAFLKKAERAQFHTLARILDTAFAILDVHADLPTLRQRVVQRQNHRKDASEADLQVLETLLAVKEPLQADELQHTVFIDNDGDIAAITTQDATWDALRHMTAV